LPGRRSKYGGAADHDNAGLLPPEAVTLIATWLQALVQGPPEKFGIGLIVSILLEHVDRIGDADDRRQRLLWRGGNKGICII
jgi:hypothetical protein